MSGSDSSDTSIPARMVQWRRIDNPTSGPDQWESHGFPDLEIPNTPAHLIVTYFDTTWQVFGTSETEFIGDSDLADGGWFMHGPGNDILKQVNQYTRENPSATGIKKAGVNLWVNNGSTAMIALDYVTDNRKTGEALDWLKDISLEDVPDPRVLFVTDMPRNLIEGTIEILKKKLPSTFELISPDPKDAKPLPHDQDVIIPEKFIGRSR